MMFFIDNSIESPFSLFLEPNKVLQTVMEAEISSNRKMSVQWNSFMAAFSYNQTVKKNF